MSNLKHSFVDCFRFRQLLEAVRLTLAGQDPCKQAEEVLSQPDYRAAPLRSPSVVSKTVLSQRIGLEIYYHLDRLGVKSLMKLLFLFLVHFLEVETRKGQLVVGMTRTRSSRWSSSKHISSV